MRHGFKVRAVTTAVMPKGVEHLDVVLEVNTKTKSDDCCDAERR